MALLGRGGILEISREWPDPIVQDSSTLNSSASKNSFNLSSNGYWLGDHIYIAADRGVPFDLNNDGYADCPDGHGFYFGSKWDLGPSRTHITSAQGQIYKTRHILLNSESWDYTATPIVAEVAEPTFLDGERVWLTCSLGLPIDLNGDGYADSPDGHSFYVRSDGTSTWVLAPSRDFYTGQETLNRPFYNTADPDNHLVYTSSLDTGFTTQVSCYIKRGINNDVLFYDGPSQGANQLEIERIYTGNIILSRYVENNEYTASLQTLATELNSYNITGTEVKIETIKKLPPVLSTDFYNRNATTGYSDTHHGYMRKDELDRIILYATESAALNSDPANAYAQKNVDCGNYIISRYSDDASYLTALVDAAETIKTKKIKGGTGPLRTYTSVSDSFKLGPSDRGWEFQALLQEWALDVDASNLDMTAIGETFGDNVKSVVRGAGSMQFLVDQLGAAAGQSSLELLHLVLLTQQGSAASCKFYLQQDSPTCKEFKGGVYYQCDILLTNTRVSTRADALISGTSDFVVSGPVQIRVAT